MRIRVSSIITLSLLVSATGCGEETPHTETAQAAAVDTASLAASLIPPPPVSTDTAQVAVALIVGSPEPYLGRPVVGRARVAEVVGDRGFWLEQDSSRIFAVIAKTPQMEQAVNVNAGQTVAVAGVVYNSATADQIPGELDSETRQIIAEQPAFLYVAAQNLILLGPDGA